HFRDPEGEPPGYFLEEVRRELVARFGEKVGYEGGLTVRTSYTRSYQHIADKAFREGLVADDRRHGWRGAITPLPNAASAENALSSTADPPRTAVRQLTAVAA